jgi:hypothetical protein
MDSTEHAARAEKLVTRTNASPYDLQRASIHATLALHGVIAEMTRQCDDTAPEAPLARMLSIAPRT